MTGTAPLRPPAPPIGRQALALGVALGLHVAAALAWGDGPAGRGSAAAGGLHGGAAQPAPAVVWLALPPAAAPDRPAEPAPPAVPAPAATEAPASPGGDAPRALGGATGQLSRHGEPWTLAYPDIDLGAPREALMMALQLDGARRVEGAEAVGPASGPALLALATYVGDLLLGAELGGAGALGGTACLEVVFDAAEARVAWRLREPVPGRQRCPRPAKA
ncbi:MAG: hypothetical protein O9343_16805 [Burkholderiaceae bacterium]|nr:hypothetical protein [Burkholderiaceae bacterium]